MNHGHKKYFSDEHLLKISMAAEMAEETVSENWKFSGKDWLKRRFDIKTYKNLRPNEFIDSHFAQIMAYDVVPKNRSLKSQNFTLYNICLQDHCILSFLDDNPSFDMFALILYVITHELIHVVRFSTYEASYLKPNEEVVQNEEKKVHILTYDLLQTLNNKPLQNIFDFYHKWREL